MDPSPSYPRCHADAILPLLITSKPAETWSDRPFLFRVWNAKSQVWQEKKEKAALTAQNTLTGQPHVKCRQYHVTSTYMGTSGREVESACVCLTARLELWDREEKKASCGVVVEGQAVTYRSCPLWAEEDCPTLTLQRCPRRQMSQWLYIGTLMAS